MNEKLTSMSDAAAKMLAEANREIRKLFRSSRKIQLLNRRGKILLIDDVEQQKCVLENLIARYNLQLSIHNVATAKDARDFVSANKDEIKLAVVDIMLLGSAANAEGVYTEDGITFVDWLKKNHPDIPFIITTGHEERAELAALKFPGVDVLLKGQTGIEEYADALGLFDCEVEPGGVLPRD